MSENSKITILIAEDDLAMRDILTHKLISKGYEVLAAENGLSAWDVIQKRQPNLVLTDLMMPELDGFALLEKIRSHKDEHISKLPVIVLSNLWSNQDILKAESLGVKAFMIKAYFTPEEIYAKINEALGKEN